MYPCPYGSHAEDGLGLCRNSSRGGSSVPLLDCLCQIPCTDHPGTALCDFPVEPAGDGRFSGILD